jgi:hypothetical protein
MEQLRQQKMFNEARRQVAEANYQKASRTPAAMAHKAEQAAAQKAAQEAAARKAAQEAAARKAAQKTTQQAVSQTTKAAPGWLANIGSKTKWGLGLAGLGLLGAGMYGAYGTGRAAGGNDPRVQSFPGYYGQ